MILFSAMTVGYTLVKHGGEKGFAEQWIKLGLTGAPETLHPIHPDIQQTQLYETQGTILQRFEQYLVGWTRQFRIPIPTGTWTTSKHGQT